MVATSIPTTKKIPKKRMSIFLSFKRDNVSENDEPDAIATSSRGIGVINNQSPESNVIAPKIGKL